MKLYHGSYTKITEIDLSKCARYRDFGQGFDLFYNSNAFAQLEDESTQLYTKPWQEIYELLKNELKVK